MTERRSGYCVGPADVSLVLGETLDIPIRAVATPSRMFVRYDDGTTHLNIETLRGEHVTDEQYNRDHCTSEISIRKRVFWPT